MGQVLLADNVPNIIVASTTSLTLAATNNGLPTTITVGGQAYIPSAVLTLNTGTVGANGLDFGSLTAIGLYYVYAIVNSSTFAPALIASQTGPSTGPTIPAGYYSAYKLVGAFYTNGSSQVGSIVSITGTAVSGWQSYTPGFRGDQNAGSWTNSTVNGYWRRIGSSMEVHIDVTFTATPGTGNGGFVFDLPSGYLIDTSVSQAGFEQAVFGTATGFLASPGTTYTGSVAAAYNDLTPTNGSVVINGSGTSRWGMLSGTGTPINWTTGSIISLQFTAPITSWAGKVTLL